MNTYTIYLGKKPILRVSDTPAAYACWQDMVTVAKIAGWKASLVDANGEMVEYFEPVDIE
jgi:hypothetical protein